MGNIHKFVPVSDIPAKGAIVTCPHCGRLEIWTHEEIQDHGLCRHVYCFKGGTCSICGDKWEGELFRYPPTIK